jgi:hypothetical protein
MEMRGLHKVGQELAQDPDRETTLTHPFATSG